MATYLMKTPRSSLVDTSHRRVLTGKTSHSFWAVAKIGTFGYNFVGLSARWREC